MFQVCHRWHKNIEPLVKSLVSVGPGEELDCSRQGLCLDFIRTMELRNIQASSRSCSFLFLFHFCFTIPDMTVGQRGGFELIGRRQISMAGLNVTFACLRSEVFPRVLRGPSFQVASFFCFHLFFFRFFH